MNKLFILSFKYLYTIIAILNILNNATKVHIFSTKQNILFDFNFFYLSNRNIAVFLNKIEKTYNTNYNAVFQQNI